MTARPVCLPGVIRGAWLAALALATVDAQAMSVSYQCTGRRVLTAELTPRTGQIHFEGRSWTLARVRVRSGREAHYVDAKAGVDVVTRGRTMTFVHGGETLQCLLYSDALSGDAPKGTP